MLMLSQTKYYQFSELRGMEDYGGNTHLYYRLFYERDDSLIYIYENSFYHFDVEENRDTFF